MENSYTTLSDKDIFWEEPQGQGKYNSERDFTSLFCWQDAHKLKLFFYTEIITMLPIHERNNLISQIRKASIYELKDHIISCHDIGYISNELFDKGINQVEKTKIKLNGFIKFVQNQKKMSKK